MRQGVHEGGEAIMLFRGFTVNEIREVEVGTDLETETEE